MMGERESTKVSWTDKDEKDIVTDTQVDTSHKLLVYPFLHR